MRFLALLSILPILASASTYTPPSLLFSRATCNSGDVACGSVCIPSTYTCCPDKLGGCGATDVCAKGDDGSYGCCPIGATCSGNGGSEFITETSSAGAKATSTHNAAPTAIGVSFAALAVGVVGSLAQAAL